MCNANESRSAHWLIESSVAELDIGRMLYIHNFDFNFVKRTSVKGADYDLEIKLDRWTVCADIKCKLENTPITANTIIGTLTKVRSQLPSTKPGMLFVKVPQNWMLKYLHAQLMADSARSFFAKRFPTNCFCQILHYLHSKSAMGLCRKPTSSKKWQTLGIGSIRIAAGSCLPGVRRLAGPLRC